MTAQDMSTDQYRFHKIGMDTHRLIKIGQVQEMCGGVSRMAIWRWMQDPELNFPRPIKISGRNYWRELLVIDWIEEREAA